MTRFASCLGLLGTMLADLSLCACGTNDHATTPAPSSDAGAPSTDGAICTVTIATGTDGGVPDGGAADGGSQRRCN